MGNLYYLIEITEKNLKENGDTTMTLSQFLNLMKEANAKGNQEQKRLDDIDYYEDYGDYGY